MQAEKSANRVAALLATAQSLAVDRVTTEVVRAFDSTGVDCVLLKGASLVDWLYDRGDVRGYVDSDLLVPPQDASAAERTLAALGFEPLPEPPPERGVPHAAPWGRPADGATVDLHTTVFGASASPGEVWNALRPHFVSMPLGDVTVTVLDDAGRALIVPLHAAQHGGESPRALGDLTRALERVPDGTWRRSAELVVELDAVTPFACGLRLLPEGAVVAERLGLPDAGLFDLLEEERGAPLALGFERLAQTRGASAKLALIRREVAPSAERLRWLSPLARKGSLGLAAAYVQRPLWLLRHAVPSWLAWRRRRNPAT
jgi:Uncharacterised nucleotidyltransferase